MPDGMPYYVEKGAYFSLLDALAESQKSQLVTIRGLLEAGNDLASIVTDLAPPTLPTKNPIDGPSFAEHLDRDWFGEHPPHDKRTTGWWKGYNGPVEAIMRETLIRAIEVSLDLAHGEPAPEDPERKWPIQFYWICGARWFEGWVGWREQAGDPGGVVTVFFMTPGMEEKSIYKKPQRPDRGDSPDYKVNPTAATGSNGLWVISSEEHEAVLTEVGWKVPAHGIHLGSPVREYMIKDKRDAEGNPDIVVVAPAEEDGGVLNHGRSW